MTGTIYFLVCTNKLMKVKGQIYIFQTIFKVIAAYTYHFQTHWLEKVSHLEAKTMTKI